MLQRLALLTVLGCTLMSAQDARGRITGRVIDPSGSAVPGVSISVTNTETAVKSTSVSNGAGAYDLPYLQPGVYTFSATAGGFKTYERKDLQVRVGDVLAIDIPMVLGQVSESVTVSGQASLLDTTTASVGRVVDSRRILDLPLPGGSALSLARLAPGVVNLSVPNHPSLGPAVEVLSSFSVNGVRSGNTEFTVDGTPSMWGSNAAYSPPTEMVAEFKVQTATYDAGVGRAPGGSVNVVLRSGTNQPHAAFYWFHNDNKLQSLDIFQRQFLYDPTSGPVTKEKEQQANPRNILNRFGFVFSGPVVIPKLYNGRNKTFWIYSFEGLTRPGVERGNAVYTVPTAAQRGGNFADLLSLGSSYQIYDPATIATAPNGRTSRLPFSGNVIPASRIDKSAKGLLQYFPDANTSSTADGRNNFTRLPRSLNEFYAHTAKADHNFSEKHRVFGRYNQTYQLFTSGNNLGNIANGQDRLRYNFGGVFDDVYIIGPSLLNNVRVGFTRFEQRNNPLSLGFDLTGAGFSPSLAAGIDPQALVFPSLSVSGLVALGTSTPNRSISNYYTFSDDISWTRGNHALRFGAEFRIYRENNYSFANGTPSLAFASTWTQGPLDNSPAAPIGQGLASFLLGIPSSGQINVSDSSAEQSTTTSFYIQDDWRLSSRLTINLGMRYDYDAPITERYNRSVRGFDFATVNPYSTQARANYALAPLPELPLSQFLVNGGVTFAGVNGQPRTLWSASKTNFSPRIGLAWTPLKNTVLRAGYGIFYVPVGSDRASVNQSGYTARTLLTASEDNGLSFLASLSNPFPKGWDSPPGSSGGLATDAGRAVSYFTENSKNGYMQRYSLGIQQQLPGQVFVDIGYVGNRGTRLGASREYDGIPNALLSSTGARDQKTIDYLSSQVANPFYPFLPGTNLSGKNVARNQLLRAYPQFTGVSTTESIGYSWYHSLQTTLERRFRNGFTFQTNWTYSKFMEATSFLNSGDSFLNEGISDLDRPHRFALSGIYEVPFGKGKRFLSSPNPISRAVAEGWQLSAVWQHNSGQAMGFGNALLVSSDVPLSGSAQTLDRWFNLDAFNRVTAQQLGSNLITLSPRFSGIRGPSIDNWDISAVKNFHVSEKWRMQFRAEFLNALNHSNLANPNTAPTNSLFGRISATTGFPRYLHFGLKLTY